MNSMNKTDGLKKGRRSTMILILLISVLVVAIAVSWHFSRDGDATKEGMVVIQAEGTVLGKLTLADIEKLPCTEKTMTVFSNCGGGCSNSSKTGQSKDDYKEHVYSGTALRDVLDSIDPGLTSKYKKVITKGADYYSQVIEMSDVEKPDEIYIVYSDNGKLLKTKDGRDGSLEMIVSSDLYGKRFTNWLVSIELQ